MHSLTFAYIELGLALLLHTFIVYKCFKLKDTKLYVEAPVAFRWYTMLAVATVLSMILHPGEKSSTYFFTQQMFVSFTMFTEALSLVCQLRHMRTSMAVEGLNSAYLGVMGLSRFTRIFFWSTMSSKLF